MEVSLGFDAAAGLAGFEGDERQFRGGVEPEFDHFLLSQSQVDRETRSGCIHRWY